MENKLNQRIGILFLIILLVFAGCKTTNEPNNTNTLPNNGFENSQVAKIFADNCSIPGCHAGENPQNGLSFESHEKLILGSSNRPNNGPNYGGEVVIPFDSENSLLYKMVTNTISPRMPFNRTPLTQGQIDILKRWIDNGAQNYKGEVPSSNPSYRVFVCNQASDKISVIDGDKNIVSRTADVDFINGADSPHMVKELGAFYYVTLISSGKFLKLSKSDNTVVGEINNLEIPGMIQIHHSGTKAYVSRSSSGTGDYQGIYVIDIVNMTLLGEVTLTGGVPHGIVLHPDPVKEILYVANLTKNQIHIVNTVTELQDDLFQFTSNQEPMQLNISPDGDHLYISARATNKLLVWDTRVKQVIQEIDVSAMPMHIAVRNDDAKVYISSMGGSAVDVLTRTNETTLQLTNSISHPAFSMLHGCDITSDGRFVYVSSRNLNGNFVPAYIEDGSTAKIATLGVIDTQTETVIKVMEIEEYGAGLAVEKL
jgi:DNA-binding beta-propeller fold protein YncE